MIESSGSTPALRKHPNGHQASGRVFGVFGCGTCAVAEAVNGLERIGRACIPARQEPRAAGEIHLVEVGLAVRHAGMQYATTHSTPIS